MAERITLKDVAARAGVSYQTVSKVINGTASVAAETEESIWRVVAELGYRTNVTARNLRKSASSLIGYSWTPVARNSASPILDRFLTGTVVAAEERGYHIMLFPAHAPTLEGAETSYGDSPEIYRQLALSGRVDGFIVTSTNINDERIAALLALNFPFVAFGRANQDWDFCYVDVDGGAGLCAVTRHLIEQRHRRVALLAWPEHSLAGNHRVAGYNQALAEAEIQPDPAWMWRGEGSFDAGYAAAQQLLALPVDRRPTAIAAVDDNLAIGAMRAVQDAGLVVGAEFGITGFDDMPGSRFMSPPLTTLRQPIWDVAQAIIEMLIQVIRGQTPVPKQLLLAPELIIRGSSLRR